MCIMTKGEANENLAQPPAWAVQITPRLQSQQEHTRSSSRIKIPGDENGNRKCLRSSPRRIT